MVGRVVSTHYGRSWTIQPPERTWADLQRTYWWSERAAPADPSAGTAYIYGHACTLATCAFNDLHRLSTGDLVRVSTTRGTLTYRVVAKPLRLAKTAAGIGSSFIYDSTVANRLVLITCGYTPTGSSPFNWAVIAQLTSASRAP